MFPGTHIKIDKTEEQMDIMEETLQLEVEKEGLVATTKAETPSGTTSLDFPEWADADDDWADADIQWVGDTTYESTEDKPQLKVEGQRYGV